MNYATQIVVRTFHNSIEIGKSYYEKHNLSRTYPSKEKVEEKLAECRQRIEKEAETGKYPVFYIDIDENGIHVNEGKPLYPIKKVPDLL